MIRSTYEYKFREWRNRSPQYKFCGQNVVDMERDQLEAALAFMIQFAGDTQDRLNRALEEQA